MSKRFVDTEKYRKRFIRRLPMPYKLLWDYILCECDFAGIWYVDWEAAHLYLGKDWKVDEAKAIELFNQNETRILPFDDGEKWLIVPFVEFQYGELNEKNRAHNSVIRKLLATKIENIMEIIKGNKPLISPLEGAKDKDMDKDKEMDKDIDKDKIKKNSENDVSKEVVELYHSLCPSLPKVTKLSSQRLQSIPLRVKEIGGIEEVKKLLRKVEASDFLAGRKTDFRCNFDWIFCCKNNWVKINEGQYDNIVRAGGLQLGQVINDEQSKDILEKAGF